MATHGSRYYLLLAGLMVSLAGCRGVPPAPSHPAVRPEGASSQGGSYDDTDGDGWLLGGLFGRKPASTPQPVTKQTPGGSPMVDPAVQKASAVQPLPAADKPTKSRPPVVYLADDSNEPETPQTAEEEEKKSFLDYLDFAPEKTYTNIKAALGYGPDRKLAKQYFEEGLQLYKEERFKEAAAKFKAAAARWPDSTLEEDALFLQGESHFFADDYPKADDTFGGLMKKYDNSRHLDKVMLREFTIARYWDELHQHDPHWPITLNYLDRTRPRFDTSGNAKKAYERVALNDPTGPLADDALMALGNWYFVRDRYEESADYYDRLRREHPNSKHVIDSHLLLIKSKQLSYQGPLYDGTALKETGELAEQAVRQFGTRLGTERERLIELENRVDFETARRDWVMAEFYEGKKQYGAARFYYNEVIKNHPEMEIARAAQKRLEEIKDFPDKPPNRFKFLTDLFPDNR